MPRNDNYSPWWQSPIVMVLAVILLSFAILWEGVAIGNAIKSGRYIGQPANSRDTITITGEGKVTAIPDIATVNVGLSTENKVVADAQTQNSVKFNKILSDLQNLGVKAEDIQTTDYSINPVYDYKPDTGQTLRDYQVTQSVTVKIRDLTKISDVLSLAGQNGANNVSGINFTIDDPEKLKQQAREEALRNAQMKAAALAQIAGASLGKITSFSESDETPPSPGPMFYSKDSVGAAPVAPTIQPGSLDIVITATVSYEVL